MYCTVHQVNAAGTAVKSAHLRHRRGLEAHAREQLAHVARTQLQAEELVRSRHTQRCCAVLERLNRESEKETD